MRKLLGATVVTLALLSAAACSRSDERASDEFSGRDAQGARPELQDAAAERAAPGIVPTAAPGVAFAYHYGFRMPDAAISAAQEAHAAACEKLGLAKCRITGMTYELDDRDRVDGTLEIAIDPLLARGFGRDAIAIVEKHEGKLRYARITGEDQNPLLDEAARREGNANRTIAQLEADLTKAKDENERVQLREQIRQLRADIQSAQSSSAESEAKIQRTPMTFAYRGGAASRGFAGENPATEAWYLFVDSAATLVGFVLKALAIVLPWLVLVLLIAFGWRSRLLDPVRRAWRGRSDQSPKE
ncbi:MAG TPA: DUF4349 domain-containing protein [Sphingomicrobium sp.]|nr:DUF4349 domain-containing protein [Sphingomicrobium sp.]